MTLTFCLTETREINQWIKIEIKKIDENKWN